jgi:hypothetical protein
MACFNSRIPVRADSRFRPLDLKRRERSRSDRTDSLKWIYPICWIEIGRSGKKKRGRGYMLGFRQRIPVRACRRWMAVTFRWLLDDSETTTAFGTSWRARERERRPRLLLVEGKGVGWRSSGRQCASGSRRRARFAVKPNEPRAWGGAQGQGGGDRGVGRGSGSPTVVNLSGASAGTADLRWAIPSLLLCLKRRCEKEKGAKALGYL